MANTKRLKSSEAELQLDIIVPDSVQTVFANEVATHIIQGNLILSFFEVRLPFGDFNGDLQEKRLNGYCVSRLAVPLERVSDLIGSLQSQMEKFKLRGEERES